MSNEAPRHRTPEPSYRPDLDGEISFVEHLTDEIMLLVQQGVRLNVQQNNRLERSIKKYLNRAL